MSLLGKFAAYLDERPLTQLTAQKAQALLIYLAVESKQVHRRDALMTLFWPDYPQKSAQQSLRQTLYLLRQAVESEAASTPLLLSEGANVTLNPAADLTVDVVQFEQLSGHGRSPREWQQAVDLYRGDFLCDFYLPDSEPFEEWAAGKRAFYQRRIQELLKRLGDYYLEIGDISAAEMAVRRQLDLDNLQESAHRQLMEILARSGRRQEALSHYDNLRQLLQDELVIEPDANTITLVEAIRAGSFALASVTAAPMLDPIISSEEQQFPNHNLPHLLSSFIGREKELAEIGNILTNHRLVMLTGVGGIGKTTLAIQAGHQLLETFPDGVWLVELAAVVDPERVAQTAVYALGLRELSKRPSTEILLDYLQEKECLLILDNCEHLIQAIAQFTQSLLQALPQLKILATSREIFDLPGETTYNVPPLSLPENQQLPTLEQWSQYEAIRLFVNRANTVLPEFQVTEDNLDSLYQICQKLDGIPLALELAAVRVKMLTTTQIAARLEHRFSLLTTGNRNALPRQQTLRALVDWSWDLLTISEQVLLRRLSIFAGGMSLEAVETVCAGDSVVIAEILDLLTQLVNKSLLIADRKQGQETRYRLLETIRQYGWERLAEAGEREKFQQRHLDCYYQLGMQAEQALVGPDQADWLKQLELELDNVRVALNWAQAVDVEAGLRLATALWNFWDTRGYAPEGETWLTQFLELAGNVDLHIKARALSVQSDLNFDLFNLDEAHRLGIAGLTLYREIEDSEGIAFALNRLAQLGVQHVIEVNVMHEMLEESLSICRASGNVLEEAEALRLLAWYKGDKRGDFAQAREYLKESLSIYQHEGHLGGMAIVLFHLAWFAIHQGDFINGQAWLEKNLALIELLSRNQIVWTLGLFAVLHSRMGNYEQAHYYFEKGLELSQRIGQKGSVYWLSTHFGYHFLRTGEIGRARELFIEGQQNFLETDTIIGVVYALEGLASLAVSQERPEKALRLFAWAETIREAVQNPRLPLDQVEVDKDMAAIREMIDEERYAAAYATGQTMTMEEAIALALGDNNITVL